MIAQTDLESIKSRVVQIIDNRVTLKKRGSTWWGLCPWHNDKQPSLAVSPSKGRWKCFGCGKSGDAIDFIMAYEDLDFRGATRFLGLVDGKPLTHLGDLERARDEAREMRMALKTEWELLAAGLRYIGRLIARTKPLERGAWWWTAEAILNEHLDDIEARLR